MRGSYTDPDLPPPIIFIVTSKSPTPAMSSPNSLVAQRGTITSARSSASKSNPGVSFTIPSPNALASPPSNNRIAADSIDPSGVDHFVGAIARHSVASPQAVLPTPLIKRSTPYNQRANGIVECSNSVGQNLSTLSTASITTSCGDAAFRLAVSV